MGQVWTEEDIETEDGLKIVARWTQTVAPDYSHYGRFIQRQSDATTDEMVLKNPRCWRGDTLIRTDVMPYFTTARSNFTTQVDDICPDEDSPIREEAVAFVTETWKPLIERIANGSYRALDIEVRVVHAATGILRAAQTPVHELVLLCVVRRRPHGDGWNLHPVHRGVVGMSCGGRVVLTTEAVV
jgi:hypothetical protein